MADASSFFNFYSAADKSRPVRFAWYFQIARSLLASAIMAILIDMGIVMFMTGGLEMLKETYRVEVQYLSTSMNTQSIELVTTWVSESYRVLFIETGIHAYLYTSNHRISSPIIAGMWPLLQGAMIGFQVFMIRLSVIVLFMPFILMTILVSISDGFLGWYLRRTSGARESGFIYHRSKFFLTWGVTTLCFLYLVPPFAVNPLYIFIPLSIMTAACTRLSVQYFKKYDIGRFNVEEVNSGLIIKGRIQLENQLDD